MVRDEDAVVVAVDFGADARADADDDVHAGLPYFLSILLNLSFNFPSRVPSFPLLHI